MADLTVEECIDELGGMHSSMCHAAADHLERLQAENARLREALKPFSDEAGSWGDHVPDDHVPVQMEMGQTDANLYGSGARFTVGDLRRAAAAYGETNGT